MNEPQSTPKKLAPHPGHGKALQNLDAIADSIVSGRPARKVLRGIEKSETNLAAYSPDPNNWEVDETGKVIPQICWGGLTLPIHQANLHFLVAGVPGTGKTLTIRSLLRSIFHPELRASLGGSDRAVIYDAKQEFYPMFRGFGCKEASLVILNPFDRRSDWWDLARDYTSSADAHQLARTIIPVRDNHSQPFFPKSAAAVLAAVISVHIRRMPGRWDLAHVLMACMTRALIDKVFSQDPSNGLVLLARNCLTESATSNNVMAELASHVVDFLPVAACWRRAAEAGKIGVSIKQFLASPDMVVLLGANQTHQVALSAINQLFLKRLAEESLDHVADGQWEAQNRTWLVLDEVRELGKVEGLSGFINKGRSRGVCAVLGFQDYPGLKNSFGEHVAHEVTATCQHKLFLKLGGESAEWASRTIGKSEVRETNFSKMSGVSSGSNSSNTFGENWSSGRNSSGGPSGGSSGSSSSIGGSSSETKGINLGTSSSVTSTTAVRETDAVLASEIAHLPSFSGVRGLCGFMCQSASETAIAQVTRIFVEANLFLDLECAASCEGFVPRDRTDQELF
jgi:DNA polymerase III delta prime subunit